MLAIEITVEFFVIYSPTETVYFMLRNQTYLNNSIVAINYIGEGDNALLCMTDKDDCCRGMGDSKMRLGEFYFPNNSIPRFNSTNLWYRKRGPQVIRLNRMNNVLSPTGRYRCVIPDSSGMNRSIYINIEGLRMSCGYFGNVQLTITFNIGIQHKSV